MTSNTRTMVVPAYFSNSGAGVAKWAALNTAARKCRLIAVANPGNGPGASASVNYTNAFNALIAAGGHPIGYVYCGNGTRSAVDVDADVLAWVTFYPMVKGIWFDENFDHTGAKLTYFEARYDYARSVIADALTIGNHGTYSLYEGYLTSVSKADMYCTWENDAAVAITYPSYIATYPRGNFCVLQYNATAAQMHATVPVTAARNYGNYYVTDDDVPNPWDAPPPYLQAEASKIGPPKGCVF